MLLCPNAGCGLKSAHNRHLHIYQDKIEACLIRGRPRLANIG